MSDIRIHAGAAAGALAPREYHLAHEPHPENGTALGFWLYLMSDCLIFAALFATYGVLGRSYAGGPTGAQLFDLTLVALNTAFLLMSSITFGFAMLCKQRGNVPATLGWLLVTGLFGLAFIGLELYEFAHLIHEGAGPQRSAFLSAFFALVGTHGLHVSFGLIWLVVLTAIPFWLVMAGVISDRGNAVLALGAFAVAQILVHMVCFLHMNGKAEGGWTMLSTIFSVVFVAITIAGTLWVMFHMNTHMMPGHAEHATGLPAAVTPASAAPHGHGGAATN